MVDNGRQLVIVALPSEDDPVRNFSSEKEPHLTLLYLGAPDFDSSQVGLITEYVEHAASLLSPFVMDVESRGLLGDKQADVLLFNKKWSQNIATFRSQLLKNDLISEAYLSTDQFPEWNQHLTMGFPETPAKKDDRDYPGFTYVRFDRIALWTDDYSGPTFQLKHRDYDETEAAMSQTARGRAAVDDVLAHYGVKGMKWGIRRSQSEINAAPTHSPSSDSSTAAKAVDKAGNAGGLRVLSNQELQQAITRINLENQYHNLTTAAHQSEIDRGLQSTQKILKIGRTAEDVRKFLNTPTGKAVKTGVSAAFTAAAAYATGGGSAAAKVGTGIVVRRAANHFTNVGN